jgi:hypothetical protein
LICSLDNSGGQADYYYTLESFFDELGRSAGLSQDWQDPSNNDSNWNRQWIEEADYNPAKFLVTPQYEKMPALGTKLWENPSWVEKLPDKDDAAHVTSEDPAVPDNVDYHKVLLTNGKYKVDYYKAPVLPVAAQQTTLRYGPTWQSEDNNDGDYFNADVTLAPYNLEKPALAPYNLQPLVLNLNRTNLTSAEWAQPGGFPGWNKSADTRFYWPNETDHVALVDRYSAPESYLTTTGYPVTDYETTNYPAEVAWDF